MKIRTVIQGIKKEYGQDKPDFFIQCKRNDCKKADWVLIFKSTETNPAASIRWLYVDEVYKGDNRKTYEAVQVRKQRYYAPPPFKVDDKKFKLALKNTIKGIGVKKFKAINDKSLIPSIKLIEIIYNNLRNKHPIRAQYE